MDCGPSSWHNFFANMVMDDKKDNTKGEEDRKSDHKYTAGDLPEREEQFEDSSWAEKADHGVSATESERKNVSKTLPDKAEKEKGKKDK